MKNIINDAVDDIWTPRFYLYRARVIVNICLISLPECSQNKSSYNFKYSPYMCTLPYLLISIYLASSLSFQVTDMFKVILETSGHTLEGSHKTFTEKCVFLFPNVKIHKAIFPLSGSFTDFSS